MNEEKIVINGEEYTKTSTIIKTSPMVGLMDAGNISLYVKILDEQENESEKIIKFLNPALTFKYSAELEVCKTDFDRESVFTPNGTKFSYGFYQQACKIFNALEYSKNEELSLALYECWDENNKEYKRHNPVLLRHGNYAVVIAPRVED
jgi:hypothetical protein